jgi:hypothetical protein
MTRLIDLAAVGVSAFGLVWSTCDRDWMAMLAFLGWHVDAVYICINRRSS